MSRSLGCIVGIALLVLSAAPADAQCPTRGPAFTVDGVIDSVSDLLAFDDGSGAALYAAGNISAAGDVAASGVVRWNGARWEAVGTGLGQSWASVSNLAVFDDGSGNGAQLYAGGGFTTGGGSAGDFVARWNGASWSAVGAGPGSTVFSLRVLDLGQGPRLVAGVYGWNTVPLRVWDGSSWSPFGAPVVAGRVVGVEVFNGQVIIAAEEYGGGVFGWNGAIWQNMGAGLSGMVRSLALLDDGTGAKLYCGTAGNTFVWNGAAWSALGTPGSVAVMRIAMLDTGTGLRLHVAGYPYWGGSTSECVLRRGAAGWETVGGSQTSRGVGLAFAQYDDGHGTAVYVGGNFGQMQGDIVQGVARWDGQHWRRLGSARGVRGPSSTTSVQSFASFTPPGAARPWVYAGGNTAIAGDTEVRNIAAWDGADWHALGGGVGTVSNAVAALAVYDEPGAAPPALYAGGDFLQAGGVGTAYLARWNGSAWSKVGTSPLGGLGGVCRALIAHDDGSGAGACLYAGGSFNLVNGNVPAKNVARWNGTAWQALGDGLDSGVWALALYDDPQIAGPAQLFAVGQLSASGTTPMQRVARWDGTAWHAVGSFPSSVTQTHAVAWNDGSGEQLVVGGLADGVVRSWDGTAWSSLPSYGVPIAAFDDGTGSQLYTSAGRYDGSQLTAFAGLSRSVGAVVDEGDGLEALWFASWENVAGTACIGVGRYANPCGVLRSYCTAKLNSQGCLPAISWSGVPSSSSIAPFAISATQLLNQENGLFFYGLHGRGALPFYGGTLCVKPPLARTFVNFTGGSPVGQDCSGTLDLDFNAWIRSGADASLFPGVRVDGQFWARDSAAPSTVELTDAIEFEIQP